MTKPATRLGWWLMRSVRMLIWITDLDDGSGSCDWTKSSPSLTKLAGAAAVTTGLYVAIETLQVTASINALVFAGISTLFGRGMFKKWLDRGKWSAETKQEHVTIDQTTKIITERRDQANGIEATP